MRKHNKAYNLLVVSAVPALVIVALLNLGLVANAGCQLWWEPGDVTCTVVNSLGHFTYSQDTQWGSAGKGTWTVTQAISHGLGSNVKLVGFNPSSSQVSDGGGVASSDIPTACQGNLIDLGLNGTSSLNAWDGTGSGGLPECSGAHGVTVKRNGQSCP